MPDPDPEIRGVGGGREVYGHPDPQIREGAGLPKNFFRPFGPQFGPKIRVGAGVGPLGPSPGFVTVIDLDTRSIKTSKHPRPNFA